MNEPSLRLLCCSEQQLARVLHGYQDKVLALIAYGHRLPCCPPQSVPLLWVDLPVWGTQPAYEIWVSRHRVTLHSDDRCQWASDGSLLFGILERQEGHEADLETTTRCAYTDLFAHIHAQGYPELQRVWNYFPRINETGVTGLERYREFNCGRHEAFGAQKYAIAEGKVAGACALGTRQGNLAIGFLAGKIPCLSVENPRQTSAYRYPLHYGPKRPTFSRAILVDAALLISGTSSIIGSQTVHGGDVMRQLEETLDNLQAVMGEARRVGWAGESQSLLVLHVYVRHEADFSKVALRLQEAFGAEAQVCYLQADICRADLLIEIEAYWMPRHDPLGA